MTENSKHRPRWGRKREKRGQKENPSTGNMDDNDLLGILYSISLSSHYISKSQGGALVNSNSGQAEWPELASHSTFMSQDHHKVQLANKGLAYMG